MKKCIVCNSKNLTLRYIKNNYRYFLCNNCKCLQLFLKRSKTTNYLKFSYKVGRINESIIRSRARVIITELKYIFPGSKSLVDIGCGSGFMLHEFSKVFNKVEGIEPSKMLYKYAFRTFGLKIYNNYFERRTISSISNKFDVVILSHIIEHLTNPYDFIRLISKVLNRNGILYIETPNVNSWLSRFENKNYTFLTPPEHVCLYSQKGLELLIKKAHPSIKIIKKYTYSDSSHLIGILSKFKRFILGQSKIYQYKNKISKNKQNLNKKDNRNCNYKFGRLLSKLLIPFVNCFYKGSYFVYYVKLSNDR